jgi:D-hexose-6-phosphate mutarotase
LFYFDEVGTWVKNNFHCNREGDPTDHSTQLAYHEYLHVNNITVEYLDALAGTRIRDAIESDWKENPDGIRKFIMETEMFDQFRGQDWKKTFPEVAEFYCRYL